MQAGIEAAALGHEAVDLAVLSLGSQRHSGPELGLEGIQFGLLQLPLPCQTIDHGVLRTREFAQTFDASLHISNPGSRIDRSAGWFLLGQLAQLPQGRSLQRARL